MKAPREICVLLTILVAGFAWANESDPPSHRPPILMTADDTSLPAIQCTASALEGDVSNPLALLAPGCSVWTRDTCEIWLPQSGPGVAWSVLSTLLSPDMSVGHEAMHCRLHHLRSALPWV